MAKKKTTRKKTARKRPAGNKTPRKSAVRASGRRKPGSRSKLAGASLTELQGEIARRLDDLQQRRTQLLDELDALDSDIAHLNGTIGAPAASGGSRRRPRNKANLVDSLKTVLKGKTFSVKDLSAAVQRAGYMTTSPNFRTIVNQALISNPRVFKKIARGQYTAK